MELELKYSLSKKGDYFGDISFLTNEASRFIYKVGEPTVLIRFNKSLFMKILKNFQKDFERFCVIRD
jgi:hypothetical protein